MARVGYPGVYDPDAPCLGIQPADYALLETYYDRGAEVIARLGQIGAVRMEAPWLAWDGRMFPDYFEFPENRAVRGRGIQAVAPGGGAGNGGELIRQLMAFASDRGTEVRLEHRVVDLVVECGEMTGGWSSMTEGPVGPFDATGAWCSALVASPTVPNCGSDSSAVPSPEARESRPTPATSWHGHSGGRAVRGDAQRLVEPTGSRGCGRLCQLGARRVGHSGRQHGAGEPVRGPGHRREAGVRVTGRVHHVFAGDEYVNRVMFMVYDQRTADRFGGRYPIPPPGAIADHVTTGAGVAGLSEALETRLRQSDECRHAARHRPGVVGTRVRRDAWPRPSPISTPWPSAATTTNSVEDPRPSEFAFHGPAAADNRLPNSLMYPIDTAGPLHAISLVGTTFDTNSGPRVGADGQDPGDVRTDQRTLRGGQLRGRSVRGGLSGRRIDHRPRHGVRIPGRG